MTDTLHLKHSPVTPQVIIRCTESQIMLHAQFVSLEQSSKIWAWMTTSEGQVVWKLYWLSLCTEEAVNVPATRYHCVANTATAGESLHSRDLPTKRCLYLHVVSQQDANREEESQTPHVWCIYNIVKVACQSWNWNTWATSIHVCTQTGTVQCSWCRLQKLQ